MTAMFKLSAASSCPALSCKSRAICRRSSSRICCRLPDSSRRLSFAMFKSAVRSWTLCSRSSCPLREVVSGFPQLFFSPLASGQGAAVRFAETDDQTCKEQEPEHSRNFSLGVLQSERLDRRQEPIPNPDNSGESCENGRAEPTIPDAENCRCPERVIRIALSQKRSQHSTK